MEGGQINYDMEKRAFEKQNQREGICVLIIHSYYQSTVTYDNTALKQEMCPINVAQMLLAGGICERQNLSESLAPVQMRGERVGSLAVF